ncbi:MAG TPA: BatA domain-containing protein [Gemmatimonadaceae bacterium]
MSFLAPWYLLLGAAALVPLLIHLLRRRIGVQVEFPAARYLARAEREHSRTLRMRNLLLMLLRILAVLLLAAAAARPTARGAGAGHAPTALAIVIDNSMSTSVIEGGAPLLEHFKRAARDALASASPDDRLWLVTADASVRGGTGASIKEELDRVRTFPGAGRMRDAVARAVAAVEASGMDARQVAVLTDGQRTTWNEPAQLRGDVPVLIWAPGNAAPVNRAVVLAEARPVRWTPRGAIATRILSPDSTTYRMALGQRTLARGTAAPGEETIVRAAPAERGWTDGTVDIEPDELSADNARHFALWIGSAPTVRVAPSAGAFVRNAVDVLRASERVAEGSGILVASADEASTIPALLLPPIDPVRLGAANRSLERLGIPWRFGAMKRESSIARGEQMQGVSVTWRYQLVPRGVPDAETLAVVGREPWIVSGHQYVIVASPLVPEATSLPVAASFLPWLGDVLAARLHADPGGVHYAAPGDRVTRPAGADAIESASGGRTTLDGTSFDAPVAAGTYFFIQGARRVGALVVNPEVAESQLDRWPPGELKQRIVSANAHVARDRDEWVRLSFSGAARRSLVFPLLLATLLILGVETVAATSGGGGGRAQQ